MPRFEKNIEIVQNEEKELKQYVRDIDKHQVETVKARKLAKASAWRMAAAVNALQTQDHRVFIDMVHAEGVSVDEWVAQRFAAYTSIGGRYVELVVAVGKGMTQRALLRDGAGKFLADDRAAVLAKKEQLAKQRAKPGTESEEEATVKEAGPKTDTVEYWRARCRTLGAELRETQRELERLEKKLGELAAMPVGV
jgi:predicted RNase H-like nuclease (RuvC/YqgF family)